jgi:hypothetical protein
MNILPFSLLYKSAEGLASDEVGFNVWDGFFKCFKSSV